MLVVGLLAWYLLQVLRAQAGGMTEVATSAELPTRLARWSTVAAPAQVHAMLAYPPPQTERDWLAALNGTGTAVSWSGTALVPTAVALEPVADPARGADLTVAAPPGAPVVLRDALGVFDTVTAGPQGVRVYLPSPPAVAEAAVGPVVATARLRDSLRLGRLLLLGEAGWEAKFVAAALEERGWSIDVLLSVSPKGQGDVRQGTVGAIDTAMYSAVLAIDTIAGRYAASLARYVRSGGGLVLWPEAASAGSLTALALAVAGATPPGSGLSVAPTATAPRRALTLAPLGSLKPDALTLEHQDGRPALAAWRVGAGRVLQIGYVNTWRWRMAGLNGANQLASDAHRDWLARVVAAVAYTGRHALPVTADAAPLATLIDRLGAPTAPHRPSRDLRWLGAWIFGVLMTAAVLEWASRRVRGAK